MLAVVKNLNETLVSIARFQLNVIEEVVLNHETESLAEVRHSRPDLSMQQLQPTS